MKFSTTHFEALKSSIETSGIDLFQSRMNYRERGLSETRYLWDIFWATGFHKDESFKKASYKDAHIQTAVKKAVTELLTTNY